MDVQRDHRGLPMVIVSSAALTPGVDSSLLQLSLLRDWQMRESLSKGHLCLQHLALTAPGSANARRGLSKAQLWTALAKNCPRWRPREVKACTGCAVRTRLESDTTSQPLDEQQSTEILFHLTLTIARARKPATSNIVRWHRSTDFDLQPDKESADNQQELEPWPTGRALTPDSRGARHEGRHCMLRLFSVDVVDTMRRRRYSLAPGLTHSWWVCARLAGDGRS